MKKLTILFSALFLGLVFLNFTSINDFSNSIPEEGSLNMTEDVKSVIDHSCYGCHNTDSKNDKGKKKLNFDSFGKEYSEIKSGGKLKEIAIVVNDNDMPPAKFLEHYPEKALTEDQKTLLINWAKAEAKLFSAK